MAAPAAPVKEFQAARMSDDVTRILSAIDGDDPRAAAAPTTSGRRAAPMAAENAHTTIHGSRLRDPPADLAL